MSNEFETMIWKLQNTAVSYSRVSVGCWSPRSCDNSSSFVSALCLYFFLSLAFFFSPPQFSSSLIQIILCFVFLSHNILALLCVVLLLSPYSLTSWVRHLRSSVFSGICWMFSEAKLKWNYFPSKYITSSKRNMDGSITGEQVQRENLKEIQWEV